MSGVEFSEEEWEELFGDHASIEPTPKRRWVRFLGITIAVAMLATGASAAFDLWRDRNLIRSPESIQVAAEERVAEAEFGWLVSAVVVEPINIEVGAFVRNNPADGIIHVSTRGWQPDDLRETIDHEIGHLIDFAVYNDARPDPEDITDTGRRVGSENGERRGGLESEVWAECYAVSTGERRLDPASDDQIYRCTPDEFEILEAEMASLTQVCKAWGEPECRDV